MASVPPPPPTIPGGVPEDKSAEAAADFANYFCTYGFLYHQKQMLTDSLRMERYYSAVFENSEHFKDKVVLDIGTGSGVLAMWAARAGARKVYAVEYTNMAVFARQLVESNGLSDIVEVIQGAIESVEIPEKVDIIISEWMGYFLMRESMLDSVIVGRDRFLKPDGAMYPSHARIYVAPITREQERHRALSEFHGSMDGWNEFTGEMDRKFGLNFASLGPAFDREQREYFLTTSQWVELHGEVVAGDAACVMDIDILTCTLEETKALQDVAFSVRMNRSERVSALLGWFDVDFAGSPSQPTRRTITLSTSPFSGYTHWGQQCFYLNPDALDLEEGDEIKGTMDMERRTDNKRLLNVSFAYRVHRGGGEAPENPEFVRTKYHIE